MKTIHSWLLSHVSTLLASFALVMGVTQTTFSQRALLQLDITKSNNQYLETTLSVTSDRADFTLGSQNYRIYYNAATLRLISEEVESELSPHQYDLPVITEHEIYEPHPFIERERIERLGFINFNIALQDQVLGGALVSERPLGLVRVRFRIIGQYNSDDIIVAHAETTSHLATAFTEFSRWIDARSSEAIQINIEQVGREKPRAGRLEVIMGPNPTNDFIIISADEPLSEATLYNVSGQQMVTSKPKGKDLRMDLVGLASGLYIVEIHSLSGSSITKELIKQ